jgi:hypothetical protein
MTYLRRALLVVALVVALPYAWGPIYKFPAPSVFAGTHFLNPYAALHGTWQRANLHAHGRAWSGVTNGQQTDQEVVNWYRNLGYTIAGISDYERIATLHGVATLPIYEHGYNLRKSHQLAIGAHRVEWFDFLLWQSTSHKQYILDQVGRSADLVAIAHPFKDAYPVGHLADLTGYQLIEVVNGPTAFDKSWDAVLSNGRAVWALANDDTHDVTDAKRTAVAWNMIDAATTSTSDVINALRGGRSYAVARLAGATGSAASNEPTLASVGVDGGQLVVTCDGDPSTFVFVGQNGAVRKTVKNVLHADYTFEPSDTYIRTVIRSSQTTMYLNPVMRYDGTSMPKPVAVVDAGATWLLRGSCMLAATALALARRRPRAPVPNVETPRVIPDATRKTA